jgi:hypothetical protein
MFIDRFMTIPTDILETLKPTPYDEIRDQVRDADLLLCSATDSGSRAIRWATKSLWSHIAIAVRLKEIDRVIVLECVEKIGVRAVPLSLFISRTSGGIHPYPGKILLARHRAIEGVVERTGASPIAAMNAFAFDRLGHRFSMREVVKIGLRILVGRFDIAMPRILGADDEYICSEYVARCYQAAGVTPHWDQLGFIAPADFANDPDVQPVAQIQTR